MNIRVCHGCPLRLTKVEGRRTEKRCDILQGKLDGVRGLGLKSINFECPTKHALFQPGQEVSFKGITYEVDESGHRSAVYEDPEHPMLDDFIGYVIGWDGNRVKVVSEQTDAPFCKIAPNRLKLTGNSRRVCIHCGLPEGIAIRVKSKGDEDSHSWECRWDYSENGSKVLPCEFTEVANASHHHQTRPGPSSR